MGLFRLPGKEERASKTLVGNTTSGKSGHLAYVQAARVLTASKDATAKIFDLETGALPPNRTERLCCGPCVSLDLYTPGTCLHSFNEDFEDFGYNDIVSADVSDTSLA